MTTPRIEIDISKIRHNSRCLVERLKTHGISVTGVTKGVCGHPAIAQAMLDGGITNLSDARISNVMRMRAAGITCPITMIRTPKSSELDQVVQICDTSYNSDIGIIAGLAKAAHVGKTTHNVVLMVEMGDMRDGILPENLQDFALQVQKLSGIFLTGIGANFACLKGEIPSRATMKMLSTIASEIEGICGPALMTVSGGNSASLPWAFGAYPKGQINNLRLGEAVLLGVDPISGNQIDGLFTNAFSLISEVIETKIKPNPSNVRSIDTRLAKLRLIPEEPLSDRTILAVGLQDTDIQGLTMPKGYSFIGASSDHLVIQRQNAGSSLPIGTEMGFQMNYHALMRSMSVPEIVKVIVEEPFTTKPIVRQESYHLSLVETGPVAV